MHNGDGTDDDKLEPFAITNDVLIELIKCTVQPEALNVKMVLEGEEEEEEDSDKEQNDSSSESSSDS